VKEKRSRSETEVVDQGTKRGVEIGERNAKCKEILSGRKGGIGEIVKRIRKENQSRLWHVCSVDAEKRKGLKESLLQEGEGAKVSSRSRKKVGKKASV